MLNFLRPSSDFSTSDKDVTFVDFGVLLPDPFASLKRERIGERRGGEGTKKRRVQGATRYLDIFLGFPAVAMDTTTSDRDFRTKRHDLEQNGEDCLRESGKIRSTNNRE
jgi:hypothetical protein